MTKLNRSYGYLLRVMYLARRVDTLEQLLVKQGRASFHVSGAGHEAMAALAPALIPEDFLHLHYRDKSLLIARGVPLSEFFKSLLATDNSHSAGRQMSAHFSWRSLNVTSIVGPLGNNALQAVGSAMALKDHPSSPISVCAVGDGTTQQGEFLEAVGEAARSDIPVLFVIEDNHWAISTRTDGRTFFSAGQLNLDSFLGIPLIRFEGWNPSQALVVFREAVDAIRGNRKPRILIVDFERLAPHTSSDDQSIYRSEAELNFAASRDPITILESQLHQSGMSKRSLEDLKSECERLVEDASREAQRDHVRQKPSPLKSPYPSTLVERPEYSGSDGPRRTTMRQAINAVLRQQLTDSDCVFLLGQDIEDPKGDVFGVTKGLSTVFPDRVKNAPLSESTIVGVSIGRALVGQKPIAFIQFADFLPLAANQIISELATMYWRTNGTWACPVVVMAPIGGYRSGVGPFHAQSFEAMFAQCPGLDVLVPSTAADAAGLLNAALSSYRPTLFLYPKALLNQVELATTVDVDLHHVLPGRASIVLPGEDLTLVGWGNTVSICKAVADRLRDDDVSAEVIDLRSISPWDFEGVVKSVRRTGKLVVVHEDNLTMGFGAEVVASVTEALGNRATVRRVGRSDGYIPFNFDDQLRVLPSFRTVMDACIAILGLQCVWETTRAAEDVKGVFAIGSGPSDDRVKIVELHIEAGKQIASGDLVAVVEASKAAVEIHSQADGVIASVHCSIGDEIAVGELIAKFEQNGSEGDLDHQLVQSSSQPSIVITGRSKKTSLTPAQTCMEVAIGEIAVAGGATRVTTEELCRRWPHRTAAELIRTTGIRERRWIGPNQTVLSMAVEAADEVLRRSGLQVHDLELVVASTGTPDIITPSLASRVCSALAESGRVNRIIAYDLNAACSSYLYAMQNAFDFLSRTPGARALLITAEILSPLLNLDDDATASLFGDAASATLLQSDDQSAKAKLLVERPVISGTPEDGRLLRVPISGSGFIEMNGGAIFSEAVKSMIEMVNSACAQGRLDLSDLDYIVPHQANQRILDAIQRRTKVQVISAIERWGNTSSCSIPIALCEMLATKPKQATLCLAAFGGGLTRASALCRIAFGKGMHSRPQAAWEELD
jgi:2-oxoisovalerate dehydrogenase E1 component